MRFALILFLSLFIFWWIHRDRTPIIDVLKCAIKRGIYNKTSRKCVHIKLSFAMDNRTQLNEKGYTKNNITSNKKLRRRIGL